ncbi:SecY protein, partial [mine drainage metagenome]
GLPGAISTGIQYLQAGTITPLAMVLMLVGAVLVIAFVILIQEGERRIPVQYAKRLVGRRMYQGTTSHIPIKINSAGVIPLIFAVSLLFLPQT